MKFDRQKLDHYPTGPGVYIMMGDDDVVLYVGKAKNIQQRLRQYFAASGDGREMIPYLLLRVHKINTILVRSEKEALLLENTLIKRHQPRFNVLLKDDKGYIALRITIKKMWPQLQFIRYKGKPPAGDLYFGPYSNVAAARGTFDLLSRLFPLRQCSDTEFARRTRPCILYDMKRCPAPCVGRCTKTEYDAHVDKTIRFLRGENKEILKELYASMDEASERLEYEQAAVILRKIRQIETTIEKQTVHAPQGSDRDVIGICRRGGDVVLQQMIFKEGKLIGSHHYDFTDIVQETHELLPSFLLQHYEKQKELPEEILIGENEVDKELLSEILSQNQKRKVNVLCPQKGEKKGLVEMAYVNAKATFDKEKDLRMLREKMLLEMQEKLNLKNYPQKIECFDNSNFSGSTPVSAMVVFTGGERDSKCYRKYKGRTDSGTDDLAAMTEVLSRRYRDSKEGLPDLLIVDGAGNQLNAALKVLREYDIVTIDVIAIAKEQGRHDKGITQERIFVHGKDEPIILKSASPILFLLQQIRDEAHRFAITYQRQTRTKGMLKSKLDSVPGIGPKKKKALLTHFGSIRKIEEATIDELSQLKFLSKSNIEALKATIVKLK
jgi:excinuclease ABC subunit C